MCLIGHDNTKARLLIDKNYVGLCTTGASSRLCLPQVYSCLSRPCLSYQAVMYLGLTILELLVVPRNTPFLLDFCFGGLCCSLLPTGDYAAKCRWPLTSWNTLPATRARSGRRAGASAALTLFLFSCEDDLERPSGDLIAYMYLKYTID